MSVQYLNFDVKIEYYNSTCCKICCFICSRLTTKRRNVYQTLSLEYEILHVGLFFGAWDFLSAISSHWGHSY